MEANITEIFDVYKNFGIEMPPEPVNSVQDLNNLSSSPTLSPSRKSPS